MWPKVLKIYRKPLKEALSINALCTCVFIFTSGSSALLGCPHWGLSIWLSLLAIFNTLFWVYVNFFGENGQNTKRLHHFHMIQKWQLTVIRCAKHTINLEHITSTMLVRYRCNSWVWIPLEPQNFFWALMASYFTTAKISFTSILYLQFTHMILNIIYTSHTSQSISLTVVRGLIFKSEIEIDSTSIVIIHLIPRTVPLGINDQYGFHKGPEN